MKLPNKPANKLIVSLLTLCAFFSITARVNSQTVTVKVDTSQSWVGFMNVSTNITDPLFQFGETWGTTALQADFIGTTNLDLSPCTNVWETTNTYYVQADGATPNAIMDASFYVDTTSLINTNVTFTGTCLSNTLTGNPYPGTSASYTCTAFIKTFNSNYSTELSSISSNMVAGQPFSITLSTAGAAHVQYGFETVGPDANPSEYPSLGNVVIAATTSVVPILTNAAPTPTNSPSSVLAMYDSSGVFSVVGGIDWDEFWSDPAYGVADYTIPNTTDVVLEYTNVQYAGVANFDINVSAYNEMHLDVWTPNANQLGVELVSLDNGGTQASQVNFGANTIVPGQWISLDIPFNEFVATNATLDLTALQQMLFIDNMGGGFMGGTFYIDNIYFYSNSALVAPPPPLPQPTIAAPAPSPDLENVQAMWDSSGVYAPVTVQDYDASWSDPSGGVDYFTITNTSNTVLEYPALQYAGWEFYNTGDEQINVSDDNTVHIDIWTPIANQFGLELVSLDSGVVPAGTNPGTQAEQVNFLPASGTIVSNQWVSLDIPLYEFTAPQNNVYGSPIDLTDLQQLLFIDNQGGGGVTGGYFYIDNFYFYESSTAQPVPLTVTNSKGAISVSLPTEVGFTYTLQWTTNLTNPSWQALSNSVTGNNYVQTLTDTDTPGTTTRFYRVSITATP